MTQGAKVHDSKVYFQIMYPGTAKQVDAAISRRKIGVLKFRPAELSGVSLCESQNPNVPGISKSTEVNALREEIRMSRFGS